MLDAQLIPIGLADRPVFVRPLVPDVAVQIGNTVGFLLPNPENLVQRRLKIDLAHSQDREFLTQVVAVDEPEALHRVRRRAVCPMRPYRQVRVPGSVLQNISAVL